MDSEEKGRDDIADARASNLTANSQRRGSSWHMIPGFSAGMIASSVFLFGSLTSLESAAMLTIFNFLFVFLIFPLRGNLTLKLLTLLMGNVIGLAWNGLFSFSANVIAVSMEPVFNTLYLILSPFLNLIWIVSYWSICLTIFSGSKERKEVD